MNPDIANFIICIKSVDINTFFPIFIFSFLSFSLYLGFIINSVAIITNAVIRYSKNPPIPNFIKFPISDTISIPNTGIDEPIPAPNMLKLNIENSPFRLTNDNINDIKYIAIFSFANTFENMFILFVFSSCSISIVFSFIF